MEFLELKHLSYDYITKAGKVHALKEASAVFEKGVVYAIVGRSGSGKSTLMSLIAGLDVPKSGEILYYGENLRNLDRDKFRREHIGMVFQSYYLLPQLTAVENVELSLELAGYKGDKRAKAEEMLSLVGIKKEQFKKRSTQFSGGEQQRIAVARAIAADPELILADEPTGNLDNENTMNVIRILVELAHKYDKCVIVITHAAEIAEKADVVLKMDDGVLKSICLNSGRCTRFLFAKYLSSLP
ncbi:MAG: ABC transporter ATP-binding protein [Clostridia bacterium]|nr:ABC transporter ATP-binding protein [Clostridia bacterium]